MRREADKIQERIEAMLLMQQLLEEWLDLESQHAYRGTGSATATTLDTLNTLLAPLETANVRTTSA